MGNEVRAFPKIRPRKYAVMAAAAWTAIIGLLLWANLRAIRNKVVADASYYARSSIEKDVLYRAWCAAKGGVYVPVTPSTPPNPYLDLPERDVTTASGRRLTLINPAYMTREVHRLQAGKKNIHSHITSLRPINPQNKPDAWEKSALQTLAKDRSQSEVQERVVVGGRPAIRLMHPLTTEKPCLRCHARQGYKEGDLRGGISITVPLAPFEAAEASKRLVGLIGLALLWILGLGGISLGTVRLEAEVRRHEETLETLRLSQEKFQKAFRKAPVWVVLSTLEEGRYIEVNEAFTRCTGYSPEEVIGRTSHELETWVHPEDRSRIVKRIRTEGGVALLEVQRKTKSGRILDTLFSGERIQINGEECLISVSIDITQQKAFQRELQEKEQLLNAIFESAPMGIAVVQDRVLKWGNRTFYQLVGYEYGELIGEEARILYADSEEYERVGRELYRDFPRTGTGNVETRWVRKDGTVFDCHLRARLLDPSAQAGPVVVTVVDISERKRAEQALVESRDLYFAVLQASPDPFVIYDEEGRTIYVNPAFTRVFGWTFEELEGKRIDFVPEDQKELTLRKIQELYETGWPQTFETRRKTKDGAVLDVLVSAAHYGGGGTASEGMVVNLKDITETKRLEAEVRQSQKMEAIGTLAAGIAHDFNNILAAMIGYTELSLADLPEDAPVRSYLKEVLVAGDRARNLVKQILTFSRGTPGELKPLQLAPIVKEAIKLLRASLPSTIEIRQRIEKEEGVVMADAVEIHQLVVNLCTNAAHAMKSGGGILDISLDTVFIEKEQSAGHFTLNRGRYRRLEVRDTGHGIHREILDRIFEPFFTTKERGEGTGMGLAMVHGIVRRLGGAINVHSEPGVGSTFIIYFPVIEQSGEEEGASPPAPPLRGTERILFVDDEPSVAATAAKMLHRLGYQVVSAFSGMEALERFQEEPDNFDVVITDLTMPRMTGIELARKIRRIRSTVPIILCTGYGNAIPAEEMEALGIHALLNKPVLSHELAKTIRAAIDAAARNTD